jgi:hypothetical protein
MNTYSINATSKCKIFYVVYINNIIYLYITFYIWSDDILLIKALFQTIQSIENIYSKIYNLFCYNHNLLIFCLKL